MKKSGLLLIALMISLGVPHRAFAYDSQKQANAAIMIIAACTWSQMGKISRGSIMSFAKKQYANKYGNPGAVDWNNAITVAEKLDKQKGLGCFK
jgi:hypothetical protein